MHVGTCHHVGIAIEELDTAVAWFRSHLGYVEQARGGWSGGTFVRMGPAEADSHTAMLELVATDEDRARAEEAHPVELAVRVADLPAAVEHLRAHDLSIDRVQGRADGGQYAVPAPGGHRLRIVERAAGVDWSLDHVITSVDRPAALVDWYCAALEYVLVERFADSDQAAYLLEPPVAKPTVMGILVHPSARPADAVEPWQDGHLAVACHDLSSFRERLSRRGIDRIESFADCGGTRDVIRDEAGAAIEIVERPPEP